MRTNETLRKSTPKTELYVALRTSRKSHWPRQNYGSLRLMKSYYKAASQIAYGRKFYFNVPGVRQQAGQK
jgi:hypothetical protein